MGKSHSAKIVEILSTIHAVNLLCLISALTLPARLSVVERVALKLFSLPKWDAFAKLILKHALQNSLFMWFMYENCVLKQLKGMFTFRKSAH